MELSAEGSLKLARVLKIMRAQTGSPGMLRALTGSPKMLRAFAGSPMIIRALAGSLRMMRTLTGSLKTAGALTGSFDIDARAGRLARGVEIKRLSIMDRWLSL